MVMVLVNDCHSDVSPVKNSDSGAFGSFFEILTGLLLTDRRNRY